MTRPPMDAFEERYTKLNAEQKEAVDVIAGPVMVIAGPGTGKTEILTMRIANILRSTKTAPEKILALTFTESGAASMRRRLTELVGQSAYRVEISTFHAFSNRIIHDYPDHFPEIVGATSVTEIDQIDILRRLVDTPALGLVRLRPFGDAYYYLKDMMRALQELKQQGVSPTSFARIAREAKEKFYANPDLYNTSGKHEGKMKGKYDSGARHVEKNLELARIYDAYQAALRNAKQYDYSDMIMFVALALEENEDLRRVLQDAYEYILVDEHQDTNDAQNKIIELIAERESGIGYRISPLGGASSKPETRNPNLFVVGDEKQAIFRFQGASLENFHYFQNRYPGVKLIALRSNYRSTQAILDAAQGVSPRETELVAKAGRVEAPAHFAVLSSPDAEYYFIAQKAKEIIEDGTMPEEIAVLYRDNRDAAPLARMFEKLRIPVNIESDQDVLGDLAVKKLVRILRAVQHFGKDVWLAEALHVDFLNIPPIDVYKLMSFAAKQRGKLKLYDIVRSEALLTEAGVGSRDACIALFTNLTNWHRAAENMSAPGAFEMIVRESGFLAVLLRDAEGFNKLVKLHALFDILKASVERNKNYTLRDFFAYLDLMEEHGVALKSKDLTGVPGRVRLMTAHRAKGMEFDYVFIMQAVDRKWGSRFHRESIKLPSEIYRSLDDHHDDDRDLSDDSGSDRGDDDADERNVFYVALTRARKEAFVTMSKIDRDGKECVPTQFVAEIPHDVLAPYEVLPYETDFSAHRSEIEFAPPPEKTPELADKAFLNALFEAQGISVTALNNYLECPWAYFYRNLVRIPEAPNKNLSFGNAVHAALKNYFDQLDSGEDNGNAYLVARFEEALTKESLQEIEYEEALTKGGAALAAFYAGYHVEWADMAARGLGGINEKRVDGVKLSNDVPVNGKLDRMEFMDEDAGDRGLVRVIDYKTGRPKTRNDIEGKTKAADGNYKRQIVFYKLLLNLEGKYEMDQGVIQFVEPDDRGKLHREVFEITSDEVEELEKQVLQVATEIRDLAFWNSGCNEIACKYCELHRLSQI